jgi:hypothetical protein
MTFERHKKGDELVSRVVWERNSTWGEAKLGMLQP